MEKNISFTNYGQRLNGILNIPDSSNGKIGVIFLHGWGTYRIGPHRIFVQAARAFEKIGIPSLRFDFRGRGESEGETNTTLLLDMVDDASAVVEVMLQETEVEEIIFLGLCSGGEVAIASSMCNSAVKGLILWSTPLLGKETDIAEDAKKSVSNAKSYWQKLFMLETWRKIIKFNVNYRLILKVIFGHMMKKPENSLREKELLEQFKTFKGYTLFIYGSNDPETHPAMDAYSKMCEDYNISSEFHVIDGANHNFYSLDWKKELLNISSKWMIANYMNNQV